MRDFHALRAKHEWLPLGTTRTGACPFAAATATAVTTAPPRDAGTPERARLTGKPAGTYCVAVRSTDAAGNASALSNVVTITLP